MNRDTLMKQIERKTGRSAAEVDSALELVLREIGSVLADGEPVSLGGYGVFIPRTERIRRNSRTGVWSPDMRSLGRKTVEFKPRKDFVALLDAKPNAQKSDTGSNDTSTDETNTL